MRTTLVAIANVLVLLLAPPFSASAQDDASRASVTYPDRCVEEERTGYVLVRFNISPSGKAIDIEVVESCPGDIFNERTIQAVRDHEFKATGELQKDIRMLMPFKLSAPEANDSE